MTIIDTFYASGGPDIRLFTLELTCPAWAAPILICNGFTDRTCVTEDARTLTFIAAAIDVALPKKDSRGAQNITIAIDNVSGEAQAKIDEAMTAEARVSATLRTYLLSDLSTPKLSRGLNLEFVGKSPTMYCSTSGVATRYGTPTYPTTISGAVGGIVAGKVMTDATIQLTGTSQVHVMNNTANGTLAGTLEIYSDATSNTLASAATKPINCEKVLLKGFQLNTGTASAFGLDPQRGVVDVSLQDVEVITGLGALSAVTILSDAVDLGLTIARGDSAGMQSFIHPNSKKVAVHGAANSPSFTIGKLANVATGINSTGFIP